MFYSARWYDVGLGRFAQADSIVPAAVQGWDRYAYVNNSPVNHTDPSGHFVVEEEDCTQLSCSNDPDPGDVKRLRRQEKERQQLVDWIEQMSEMCSTSPFAPGCPPQPPHSCGGSTLAWESATPAGCHLVGYQTWYDWSEFNRWDAGINAAGIVGLGIFAASFFIPVPGAPGIGAGIYEVTGLVGIGYDAYSVQIGPMTVDSLLQAAAELPEVGRLVPLVGLVINILHIREDFEEIKHMSPVYEPYLWRYPVP